MSGLVSAIRTLTIFPVPGKDATSLSHALLWFPLTGAMAGGMLVAAAYGIDFLFAGWTVLISVLLLILQTLLTGAMHLDGLADAADALFSMTDKNKKLAIMKDSRLGTYGVLTIAFALAIKWVCIFQLLAANEIVLLALAMIVSRASQVELAVTMPYARASHGTAKSFVDSASGKHRVGAWVITILFSAVFGPWALVAVPVSFLLCQLLRREFSCRVGGITGDLLGASSECVEMVLLLLLSSWLHHSQWIHWPWHRLTGLL